MEWHDPPADLTLSNPLWDTALSLWNRPDFAPSCLQAQAGGIVVSHILVALYSASDGFLWDGGEPGVIRHFRCHATEPLRSLRQLLPRDQPATTALREQLKSSELASERLELAWWWHVLGTGSAWTRREDLSPYERSRHNLGSIGFGGDQFAVRDRILAAWNQTPGEH